ncbi:MAG: hypothetical protein ACLFVK_04940 [Dehalococcoidia bacterium]
MARLTTAVISILVLGSLFFAGCVFPYGTQLHDQVRRIARPHSFSIVNWEINTLSHRLFGLFDRPEAEIDDVDTVKKFFTSLDHAGSGESGDTNLEQRAECILNKQIREALREESILNPLDDLLRVGLVFPPLAFEFESSPDLLVVSPRDEIKLQDRVVLDPDLTVEDKESIESHVDELGVSSLVVELGGVGFTYPTMVTETSNIRFALHAIVEEWVHQYLAFKPLGFLYLLDAVGIRGDYQVVTMNETVAGIVSKEIGDKVYKKYYAPEGWEKPQNGEKVSEFHREMRAIRIQVDQHLAQSEVEEAERFMREKREYLAEKGYYLRKLNQAYFAFHGTYAYKPGSVSPIGKDLQELRERCSSLKGFMRKVTGMTDYEELKKAVGSES